MPDGLWERDGVFYADLRDPVTRRRVRRRIGTNRKAALRVVAKLRNDLLNQRYGIPGEQKVPTFAEFVPRFMEWVRAQKPRSVESYELSIRNLEPKFGALPLNAITMAMAEEYLVARSKEFKKPPIRGRFATPEALALWRETHQPQRISKTMANKDVKSLRAILGRARRWKVIEVNQVAGVELFSENEFKRKRLLQPDEIKALINAAGELESERDLRDLILLALFMGRRVGEFLSLTWSNVDFENGLLFFPRTKKGEPDQPPMPREVADVLMERRARVRIAGNSAEYVFPGRYSRGHRQGIETAWKTIKLRAGLDGVRFHDLRHAAVSYMVMSGIDLMTIASLVGHTTADQVQSRYGHLRKEHQVASVERFAPVMRKHLGMDQVRLVGQAPASPVAGPDTRHAWNGLDTGWSQAAREQAP